MAKHIVDAFSALEEKGLVEAVVQEEDGDKKKRKSGPRMKWFVKKSWSKIATSQAAVAEATRLCASEDDFT